MLDRLADAVGRSIVDMDLEEMARIRAAVAPRYRPFSWVTGAIRDDVDIQRGHVPGRDDRQIPVRRYRPHRHLEQPPPGGAPILVYIHGGGFVLGNVENYDPLCTFLADALGALVVSIDYRLAPEHPAPAGIEDCFDAVVWLADHAEALRGDRSRMAVAGDSAGGNFAAVVTQLLRDRGDPVLRHQTLIYPVVDSTCLRRSKIVYSGGPVITRRETDTYFRHYLGSGFGHLDPADPLISPLLGRLEGLPPALVQTAGFDPLRDEGLEYARRLRSAGVEAVATDYPHAPHGFASFPGLSRGTWRHREEMVRVISRHLLPRRG